MTLRAPVRGLAEGPHQPDPELVHYLCTVHRLRTGDGFLAFDPQRGLEADATLEGEGDALSLRVGPVRAAKVTARRPITLIQGFGKADKCDAVVRDATELGVTAVLVATMDRSVARPVENKMAAREERWRRIATEAARQSGRGDVPHIGAVTSLESALDGLAPDVAVFVLWERATAPLGPALKLVMASGAERPLAFVIGPEGGLGDREIAACAARDLTPYSLGDFILRTETVAAAVLGAVRILEQL